LCSFRRTNSCKQHPDEPVAVERLELTPL
jgi:hypothetical protein